jgi:hypothetical protein
VIISIVILPIARLAATKTNKVYHSSNSNDLADLAKFYSPYSYLAIHLAKIHSLYFDVIQQTRQMRAFFPLLPLSYPFASRQPQRSLTYFFHRGRAHQPTP